MIDDQLHAQAMRYIGNSHPGREAEVEIVSRVTDDAVLRLYVLDGKVAACIEDMLFPPTGEVGFAIEALAFVNCAADCGRFDSLLEQGNGTGE